ncbi:MAG: MATE family efflux transporter [Maritimibacter sp.]
MQRLRDHMRALLGLGLPLVGSNLAQIAIGMTDTVMLGWYDVRALAAMVLAGTLFYPMFFFGSGFAQAVMPLVSAAAETGDDIRIRRATRMGMWISIGFGLMILPLFWFAAPLLRMIGQEPDLALGAQTYLRIIGWGMLPGLLVMVLKSYLAAQEHTRVQLVATLAAAAANAGLNYVLIFGHFGAPELGMRGAAIASVAVQLVLLAVLMGSALRNFPDHHLFQRLWRPDFDALRDVFRMGWHIGLTTLAEVGLFSFSGLLVGLFGAVALAAHGIALQISSMAFLAELGLSSAATVRAGRAFGANDVPRLRKGALAAYILAGGWAALAAIAFLTIPDLLVGACVSRDEPLRADILEMGRVLLTMAALFQLADASQVVAAGLLRGMQDTRAPMYIAAASYWLIGAPASWLIGAVLGYGVVGVWWGLVSGLTAAAILLTSRFLRASARM